MSPYNSVIDVSIEPYEETAATTAGLAENIVEKEHVPPIFDFAIACLRCEQRPEIF